MTTRPLDWVAAALTLVPCIVWGFNQVRREARAARGRTHRADGDPIGDWRRLRRSLRRAGEAAHLPFRRLGNSGLDGGSVRASTTERKATAAPDLFSITTSRRYRSQFLSSHGRSFASCTSSW